MKKSMTHLLVLSLLIWAMSSAFASLNRLPEQRTNLMPEEADPGATSDNF